MITNFEDITFELTKEEEQLLRPMIIGLGTKIGKANAVKNDQISAGMIRNGHCKKLSSARVRKLINFIRVNGLVKNLVATSKGYYVSRDPEEIANYKKSLQERINSIQSVLNSFD